MENSLEQVLERNLIKADGITPSYLAASIRYSFLSPGKRIRPRLLLATGEMLGLSQETLFSAAAALEMVHCFTLIHDDLPCMDNDDFRRGLPTNHKKFGESTALLAGDSLMALAIDAFLESPVAPDRLISGLKRLTWAMGPRGVIGGQAAESQLNSTSQLADLRQMHQQKTGALFSAAILIPKEFAGIRDDEPQGIALTRFAEELGLSFQVADDLEDALDTTVKNEALQPNSILYYLSPTEAAHITLKNLTQATESLERHWVKGSLPLKMISEEVVRKIEKALEDLQRKKQ
jgi:geranylgeranyl pyrophosphate synthase